MAGKHRNAEAAAYTAKVSLRLPEKLKGQIQAAAERHGRSLNDEIVWRLNPAVRRRVLRTALLALEPGLDDPRTDAEIAAEIEYLRGSHRW
jgi:plasmid stability protein